MQTRPPHNDPTDRGYHETITTDGPGGWGAGVLGAVTGRVVTVPGLELVLPAGGATAVVVSGPGVGQFVPVAAQLNHTTLLLAAPLDSHAVAGESVLAVVGTSAASCGPRTRSRGAPSCSCSALRSAA